MSVVQIGREDYDRDRRIWQRGRDEAIAEIKADLLVLLDAFVDVPEAVRVLKIGEEFGEATEAFIGLRAYNPRKGHTHSHDDVADELADVVVTTLVALGAFEVDPIGRVTRRLRTVRERHEREVGRRDAHSHPRRDETRDDLPARADRRAGGGDVA